MEDGAGHLAIETDAGKEVRHKGSLEGGALCLVEVCYPEGVGELGPEDIPQSQFGFITGKMGRDKACHEFGDFFLAVFKFIGELPEGVKADSEGLETVAGRELADGNRLVVVVEKGDGGVGVNLVNHSRLPGAPKPAD